MGIHLSCPGGKPFHRQRCLRPHHDSARASSAAFTMEKHVGAGRYAHSSLDERGRVRLATGFSEHRIFNQRNLAHVNQAGNSSLSAAAHSAFDALRSVGSPGITNGRVVKAWGRRRLPPAVFRTDPVTSRIACAVRPATCAKQPEPARCIPRAPVEVGEALPGVSLLWPRPLL